MSIIVVDLLWMPYNTFLALIPIFLGKTMAREKRMFLKLVYGLLWLVFIPNTLYILTDIIHLFEDLIKASTVELVILIFIYTLLMIISVITFVLAFIPFERVLMQLKISKKDRTSLIIIINFIIAFGVVLGRVQRLNSWDVFINLPAVVKSAVHTLTAIELLIFTVLFGFLGNFLYFVFRRMKISRKYL